MVVALWLGAERGRASGGLGVVGGAHGAVVLSPGDFFVAGTPLMFIAPGGRPAHCPTIAATDAQMGRWMFLAAFTNAFIERGFALSAPVPCWTIPVSAGIPPVSAPQTMRGG